MTVFKSFLAVFFLISFFQIALIAQVPLYNWGWSAVDLGGNGSSDCHEIVKDPAGNIYTIGKFSSGSIEIAGNRVFNTGGGGYDDAMVVKMTPAGNCIWIKVIGGSFMSEQTGMKIACDTLGNLYCAGYYYGTNLTIDGHTITNADPTGNTQDIWLSKLDSSGQALWLNDIGSNTSEQIGGLTTDRQGNVFICGYFSDSIAINGTTTHSAGRQDVFTVKYNTTGSFQWARYGSGTAADLTTGITTDTAGNVFVTGYYSSPTLQFNAAVLTNTHGAYDDIFIVQYSPTGNVVWTKNIGSNADETVSVIKQDHQSIYLVGNSTSDSLIFGTDVLHFNGYRDLFIARCDLLGNWIWAKAVTSPDSKFINDLYADEDGNLYLAGIFNGGTLLLDSVSVTPYDFSNFNLLVAKYTSSGTAVWAKSAGSHLGNCQGTGICGDAFNTVYVGGILEEDMYLDNGYLESNFPNLFIVKLVDPNNDVDNLPEMQTVTIYPNPVQDQLAVSSGKEIDNIELMDLYGQVLKKLPGYEANRIMIENLDAGTYLLRINFKKSNPLVKFIVKI